MAFLRCYSILFFSWLHFGAGLLLRPADLKRSSADAPIIIAGVGDSGTRGVKELMEKLGVDMCWDTNDSQDNQRTDPLLHPKVIQHLKNILRHKHRISLSAYQEDASSFQALVRWQKQQVSSTYRCAQSFAVKPALWGFKNPQQLYMWPISEYAFGGNSRLLVVLRDPRDICTSRNQNQFKMYCDSVLGRPCANDEDDCYSFWAKLFSDFLDEHSMKDTVKFVRIEDLSVSDPALSRRTVQCLLSFANIEERSSLFSSLLSYLPTALAGPDEIQHALEPLHAHRSSYLGWHYNATEESRMAHVRHTKDHHDPLVQETMLRLGYDPNSFKLLTPREHGVC